MQLLSLCRDFFFVPIAVFYLFKSLGFMAISLNSTVGWMGWEVDAGWFVVVVVFCAVLQVDLSEIQRRYSKHLGKWSKGIKQKAGQKKLFLT